VNVLPGPLQLGQVSVSPTSIKEGESVVLTGSFEHIDPLSTHTVQVTWGDGTTSAAVVNEIAQTFVASHAYDDDAPSATRSGPYTIGVVVSDQDGHVDGDGHVEVISVQNIAPMAAITGAPATSPAGN